MTGHGMGVKLDHKPRGSIWHRKSYKPLSKQKSEELKDKNQLLEALNKQLHQKLIETQGELKDLTQKVELLEKFQDNCLAILESKGLNPGSETLASQQDSTEDHMDSMLLLQTLQDELKLFNETAKKQMEELQALKTNFEIHKHKSYELACETRNRGLRILGTNTAKAGPRSPPAPPSWLKPVQMH
ncbi:hypothetical protein Celaphus_00015130 [Cervus elaphus hippelaphus]|uniref:KNSTRN n=1 Tax=Cervus elaphus hippelaphus TaxID=46360 RepID=A0A212CRZ2_CEREH|nr:hypothetical protein Celaphus_00015130 [Cervus elaphus hippelaphus]